MRFYQGKIYITERYIKLYIHVYTCPTQITIYYIYLFSKQERMVKQMGRVLHLIWRNSSLKKPCLGLQIKRAGFIHALGENIFHETTSLCLFPYLGKNIHKRKWHHELITCWLRHIQYKVSKQPRVVAAVNELKNVLRFRRCMECRH